MAVGKQNVKNFGWPNLFVGDGPFVTGLSPFRQESVIWFAQPTRQKVSIAPSPSADARLRGIVLFVICWRLFHWPTGPGAVARCDMLKTTMIQVTGFADPPFYGLGAERTDQVSARAAGRGSMAIAGTPGQGSSSLPR
jgi:hypothetical protein